MVKNVIFDMGNVVLQFVPQDATRYFIDDPQIEKEVLSSVFFSQEWLLLDIGLITEEEALARMLERLDTDTKKELANRCFEEWHTLCLHPIEKMRGFMKKRKEEGYGIYILSNASLRLPKHAAQIIPYWEMYDGAVFSAEIQYMKPQKEMYEILFSKYGLQPEECFFIDDKACNIAAGEALGMPGHVFDGNMECLEAAWETQKNTA